MRLIKNFTPSVSSKVKNCLSPRQWSRTAITAAMGSLLILSACETAEQEQLGVIDSVEGPLGGIAADEPRATLVAQDILSAGGSAADAATALYFTLSVTYPIAASLGGGGECVVYDNKTSSLEALSFPVGKPKNGGEVGVPGNIRGFAALHARYGKLPWSSLLAPAEKLANFGENMSRAQHVAMLNSEKRVYMDERLSAVFKKKDGTFYPEGTRIEQIRLSSVLTNIRSKGGAFFYGGALARSFVEEVNLAGGNLVTRDLIDYRPVWQEARTFDFDVLTVGLSTGEQGRVMQNIWQSVFSGKGFLQLEQDLPLSALVAATAKEFGQYTQSNAYGSGANTSFVTTDKEGNAVACSVGMGKPFGTGKMGRVTGIILAPVLKPGEGEFPTSPMLIVNNPNKDFYFAAGGSGGATGTLASVYTALGVFAKDRGLEVALDAARAFTLGPGLPLLYERGVQPAEIQALANTNPIPIEVQRIGVANAIYCAEGKLPNCMSRADRRGYGLSLIQR
ncbi:hypothetical protein GUA87_09980 [Sneathiella sp. P13V-1]|uniref:gamma-glutamyltransferase n=1 Tax=Sneathiella sp. P13V-1 TaxID=2697366 RepID=UPI00187B8DAF|nr:gamma-glutamyltransferase [Sneathiella sp. P13V-1]MBE7637172.1 hypothetical protein [Sneathiella sp. P13V-1]